MGMDIVTFRTLGGRTEADLTIQMAGSHTAIIKKRARVPEVKTKSANAPMVAYTAASTPSTAATPAETQPKLSPQSGLLKEGNYMPVYTLA